MALMWLGALGIDKTRSSVIEFQSFENSWAVVPQKRQQAGLVKSIAVMRFVGDPAMVERWIVVFREMTDFRVVSQSDATQYGVSHHGQIVLAQRISAESEVDCVLFGNVTGQEPRKRLSLHLLSASGTLLWKTELSYTIVRGAKDLDEEMVTHTLLTHVRAHANELGLAELERQPCRLRCLE
jgi:TolB-like protein